MSLDDASQKRKERLALLSATKRKRESDATETLAREKEAVESTMKFRNYDPATNAPKMGFLEDPAAESDTVESRAAVLAAQVDAGQQQEVDAPLDIDTIQAKKPNWDLKRDLERRLQPLKARQEVIVARLVRERLLAAKTASGSAGNGNTEQDLVHQIEQPEREMLRPSLVTEI